MNKYRTKRNNGEYILLMSNNYSMFRRFYKYSFKTKGVNNEND